MTKLEELLNGKKYFTDLNESDGLDDIKTEKQWAAMGYFPVDENSGAMLYPNRYGKTKYHYFHVSEVQKGTEELIQNIKAKEKEKRKQSYEKRKQRQQEEQAAQEAFIKSQRDQIYALNESLAGAKQAFYEVCRAYSAVFSMPCSELTRSVVLDVETTGLDARTDEILQISIVDAGTEEILYSSYIRPLFHREWEEAERVNGITWDMVKDAPAIHEVIPAISKLMSNVAWIIAYNGDFDVSFFREAGIVIPDGTHFYDVMEEFSVVYGEYNDYYGNFKWKSLETCAAYFQYDWSKGKAHDSLADCFATLYCFNKLQEEEYQKKYDENYKRMMQE